MKYFNNDYYNEELLKNDDYIKMISVMKEEVDTFVSTFSDSTDKLSVWGHHYFCKQCSSLLDFNPEKPHDHICTSCGLNNQSEKLDGVWVTNYRNLAIITVWKSSVLFKATKEKKYLNNVKEIINFYSDNYLQFELHNKEEKIFDNIDEMIWGCGRIMPQGLNECILIIRILNALEMVKDDLDSEFLDNFYNNFGVNAFKLLKPQVDKVHNISCWKNSAIGSLGLFFNDKEMIDFAFDGEFNIKRQLNEGVTTDSFWYEGSIHYNFFTLEGMMNLLLFSKLYNYEFGKEEQILKNMLISAYKYAFDSHNLPNPNDGWPNVNLKTYSYIYTVATKIYGEDSEIGNILKNIENKTTERGKLPLSRPYYYENRIPLERISLIPELNLEKFDERIEKPINFNSSNYGLVKNDKVNVFLKYGHRGPSHAHPDKMNIEVEILGNCLSRDLSNSGYGAKLANEWNRISASHSTVVCNGKNQISMEQGKVISFSDTKIVAKTDDVYSINTDVDIKQMKESLNPDEVIKYLVRYLNMSVEEAEKAIKLNKDVQEIVDEVISESPKIDYIREIELQEDGFKDTFTVKSDKDLVMDYFFHSEALLTSELPTTSSTLGYNHHGYQHIKNVEKVITNNEFIKLSWNLKGIKIDSIIDLNDKELFLADTFDNPATKYRKSIILRSKKKNDDFKITWNIN